MVNGIIGKKLGMTQLFLADGSVTPVTVIKAGPCIVVQKKMSWRSMLIWTLTCSGMPTRGAALQTGWLRLELGQPLFGTSVH